MAIEFARCQILHAGADSTPAKAAYNGREKGHDQATGISYDFRHHGELIDSGSVLPADAPEWAADMDRLWNEAQEKEITTDRATGERRLKECGKRKDGSKGVPQVAKDYTLALPREFSDEQNRQLLTEHIDRKFGRSNVAVQWAIHRDAGNHNPHAHLLVSTRTLTANGFGRKARELNPEFVKGRIVPDQLGRDWAAHINAFARERGLEVRVDPTRVVANRHLGKAFYIEDSRRQIENGTLTQSALDAARDPEKLLEHLTSRRATFTENDVDWHLKKVGMDAAERASVKFQLMERPEIIRLTSSEGRAIFTTSTVWEQESRVAATATSLAQDKRFAASAKARERAVEGRTMDGEQRAAFNYATDAGRLAVVKGRAGTGKSYTMGAIRDAYEADGYRVIGLAPTNTVAADMRADGFTEGRTIAAEMMRQKGEHQVWDHRTVIVVDEFAMVSTRDMERVLARAEATSSKVVAFGDDRQLSSVERGGMFGHVANVARASELTTVRRQKDDWQREASEAAARGDITTALKAYEDRGGVNWSSNLEAAQGELVRDWKEAAQQEPDAMPFVYAATNKAAAHLNDEIRQVRKELDHIDREERRFTVEKGDQVREIDVSAGDRVQFVRTVKDRATGLDLRNGEFGTVERIKGDRLTVRTDGGRVVSFDAREHNGFDLGYAGTVYKGQGKTQGRVWALHDNPNAWRSDTSYVALTRHSGELKIYANRENARSVEDLGRKMQRSSDNRPAISLQRAPEQSQERPGFFGRLDRERGQSAGTGQRGYFENRDRVERETRERPPRQRDRGFDRDR